MKLKTLSSGSSTIEFRRTEQGVCEIYASDEWALQKGLGFFHAQDRLMQMIGSRLLARGEITERFLDTKEAFSYDLISRKMGFAHDVEEDLKRLTPSARQLVEAYCEGVNTYLHRFGSPLLCKVLRYTPEPWKPGDCIALVRMHAYLGMAQMQERIERFIIQSIVDGVELSKLKALFSPYLEGLGAAQIELIRSVQFTIPFFGNALLDSPFSAGLSNNWALSPSKTTTGSPYLCFDPHLRVNALPAVWYEAIFHLPDDDRMGITAPGIPGLIMGRSRHLGASFTYGMMDTVDFFIEECRGGAYRRGDQWIPLQKREEVVKRKRQGETSIQIYETDVGVVETHGHADSPEGRFFSLGWSGYKRGGSASLNVLAEIWQKESVEQAQGILRELPMPCNWVLADGAGNIGYQQSGLLPRRKQNVLYPLPAWEKENLWKGDVTPQDLISELNPESGFIATANEERNVPGRTVAVTIPIPRYRQERITSVLESKEKLTLEDMKKLQCDLYSIQAKAFLALLEKALPRNAMGDLLRAWDHCYTRDSKEATLFEALYEELLEEVFGVHFLSSSRWRTLYYQHSLHVYAHGKFDSVILRKDPAWFDEAGWQALFCRVCERICSSYTSDSLLPWGKKNTFWMANLFLDGRLPRWCKVDYGPLQMEGSRATLSSGLNFLERGRQIITAPSIRVVTDIGSREVESALPGGPSEKPFSKFYQTDIKRWTNREYKRSSLTRS